MRNWIVLIDTKLRLWHRVSCHDTVTESPRRVKVYTPRTLSVTGQYYHSIACIIQRISLLLSQSRQDAIEYDHPTMLRLRPLNRTSSELD